MKWVAGLGKVQRERESEECKSESEIRVQQYSIAMTAANSAIRWSAGQLIAAKQEKL